jgi:hypothetical protein
MNYFSRAFKEVYNIDNVTEITEDDLVLSEERMELERNFCRYRRKD